MSASAGRVLLMGKGDYDATVTYTALDWVRYQGGAYVAKQTTTGNLPTNEEYWDLLVNAASELSELDDVTLSEVADGQALVYDADNLKWINKNITGGGSYITITTETYQGKDVQMLIGGVTYQGTFDAQGICQFEGVKETGTAVFKSGELSEILEIEYYGTYIISLIDSDIYGVVWEGTSSSKWARTDGAVDFIDPVPAVANGTGSSPFDDIMPWAGMTVEEREGGTMVKIPKFYYKWEKYGAKEKIQISMTKKSGFLTSPAHMDREDGKGERDVVYIGRYHCAENTYRSTTGTSPQTGTVQDNRTKIHDLGDNIWPNDYAIRLTILILYLVEYADWNSQKNIGYGCSSSSSLMEMGYTDAMKYHTGTNASKRTTYGGTQYRNIEGLWDNIEDYCDGIYFDKQDIYAIKNPALFNDVSGGTYVGLCTPSSSKNGVISAFEHSKVKGFEYFVYPSEIITDNTGDIYACDVCSSNSNSIHLYMGGNYLRNQNFGIAFYQNSLTPTSGGGGCRIMELP